MLTSDRDLVPVTALCLCFGFAAVAGLTGLSPPFGAFLAGLLVGSSAQRQPLYEMAKPIESILMMRSEEHTSELQSLMRISYAVFCLKKKHTRHTNISN